jgi:hypothetical protein
VAAPGPAISPAASTARNAILRIMVLPLDA